DAPRGLAPPGSVRILLMIQDICTRQHTQLQAPQHVEAHPLAELDAVIQRREVAQLLERRLLGAARPLRPVVAWHVRPLPRCASLAAKTHGARLRLPWREERALARRAYPYPSLYARQFRSVVSGSVSAHSARACPSSPS